MYILRTVFFFVFVAKVLWIWRLTAYWHLATLPRESEFGIGRHRKFHILTTTKLTKTTIVGVVGSASKSPLDHVVFVQRFLSLLTRRRRSFAKFSNASHPLHPIDYAKCSDNNNNNNNNSAYCAVCWVWVRAHALFSHTTIVFMAVCACAWLVCDWVRARVTIILLL